MKTIQEDDIPPREYCPICGNVWDKDAEMFGCAICGYEKE
jgi:hypothetical protein